MPDPLSLDERTRQVAEKAAADATSTLQVEGIPIVTGILFKNGTVPKNYPSEDQPAGVHHDHQSSKTTVDLMIDQNVYYDVPFTAVEGAMRGNELADKTRFLVEFPRGRGAFDPTPEVSEQLKATAVPDPKTDDIEMEPAKPTSFGHDLTEMFRFDSNDSFTEMSNNISTNCPSPPASLAEAVKRLKRKAAEKRVILPNAFTIRERRDAKRGEPLLRTENPRIEVHARPQDASVSLVSGDSKGMRIDHGNVILSGKIKFNDDSPTKKHQGTGIETRPVDNPPIQGPIVSPHPKMLPDLSILDDIVPLAIGIKMLGELAKISKEL